MPWRSAQLSLVGANDANEQPEAPQRPEARLVSWGVAARVNDGAGVYNERFLRGSLVPFDQLVPLYASHDSVTRQRGPLIGRVEDIENRDDGLYGRLRIAPTAAGNDALALMREGIQDRVSIEFAPVDHASAPDGTVEYRSAHLLGLALVVRGAHADAQVVGMRSDPETPQPAQEATVDEDQNTADGAPEGVQIHNDGDERRRAAAEGARRVAGVAPAGRQAAAPAAPARFRSAGHFLQAVARGEVDEATREQCFRALADVKTTDIPGLVRDNWLTDLGEIISEARPLVEAFSRAPLPDTGMAVAYPKLTQRPLVGQVTGQKVQIPSRKITVGSDTTPVLTWAGGEDVSIQVIQRSDPSYLALSAQLYAEAMAQTTDIDLYAAIVDAVPSPVTMPAAVGGASGWIPAMVDIAADVLTASKQFPTVLVAGVGVWALLASAIGSDGRPLFMAANPSNAMGSATLVSTNLNLAGLQLTVDALLPADEAVYGARNAVTTMLGPVQTMSADVPALLGRDYAMFEMGAVLIRRADAIRRLKLHA